MSIEKAESGLSQIGNARRIENFELIYVFNSFNDFDCARGLSRRSDHLVMILMPYQDDCVPLFGIFNGFVVHLRHQGAGCINHVQAAGRSDGADFRRNTVSAEDDTASGWNLLELI